MQHYKVEDQKNKEGDNGGGDDGGGAPEATKSTQTTLQEEVEEVVPRLEEVLPRILEEVLPRILEEVLPRILKATLQQRVLQDMFSGILLPQLSEWLGSMG